MRFIKTLIQPVAFGLPLMAFFWWKIRLCFKGVVLVKTGKLFLLVALTGLFFVFIEISNSSPTLNRLNLNTSYPLPSNDLRIIRQMENDYWKTINVKTMTPEQIIDFFKWSNNDACGIRHYFGGMMQPWYVSDGRKLTYYTIVDGQYPVCIDPSVEPERKHCVVYSFSIRNDWSFDEAMEKYGCEIYSFDPSLNETNHDRSEHIHFYNLGLGDRDIDSTVPDGWKFKTLDSIYRMLVPRHGETIIDYLKIDIEWQEWEVLKQIIKTGMLEKVRQLSVEFHLPNKKLLSAKAGAHSKMTVEDYRSLVGLVKPIEDRMTRFESRLNPMSTRLIKSLNNYHGPICFELSFYQILPRNT